MSQKGFRSFQHIAEDIIKYFSTEKHIWLTMKETGCFCSSPFYIAEFYINYQKSDVKELVLLFFVGMIEVK
jgi:hypothetical protein